MKKRFFYTQQLGDFRRILTSRFQTYGIEETHNKEIASLNFINSYEKNLNLSAFNILLLIEPKSITPEMYSIGYWKKFDAVVALGKYRAQKYGLELWIDLPIDTNYRFWESSDRNSTVMVNASKYSANRNSLYSLRRKVLLLDANAGQNIKLYGDHWNEHRFMESRRRLAAFRRQLTEDMTEYSHEECWSEFGKKYPQYRGKADDDFSQIRSAKLAVVIENEADYISEKIWIYLNRGVIPIYVGPNLDYHDHIKDFIIISKPNSEEILDIIQSVETKLLKSKIESYIDFASSISQLSNFERSIDNLLKYLGERFDLS